MQVSSCLTIAAGIRIIVMIINKSRSIIDINLRRAWLAMAFKKLDSNSLKKILHNHFTMLLNQKLPILWLTITFYLQNFVYNLSPRQRQHINNHRNGEVGKDEGIDLQKIVILFNSLWHIILKSSFTVKTSYKFYLSYMTLWCNVAITNRKWNCLQVAKRCVVWNSVIILRVTWAWIW